MEIHFNKKEKTLIVEIHGEIDHHTAEEIREKIEKKFKISGCKNLIFDFAGVHFMDSSGIGMLIGRYKYACLMGGRVAVAGVSEPIDRIFTISGLYKIIPGYKSVKDALISL